MPAPFTRQSVSERALARVGTTVQGKYRIDRLLGIGGTAAVYAATHRNGHRVAIKFLLDHLLDDSDMYHLFSREAYVANRVGHPGAVQVLDDDEDIDGCVFLIMPLIEGETLRARWERSNKKLPLAEVGVLIADLLDVLATAHAKGVVHRDIKPENLFVNTAAQVRVLDFGIARRAGTESTLTMTGRFIGTPAFMPPEQALGNRAGIGPHSDLWAVGATMFALLSGETVHLAEHSGAQLAAAATQHARSIAKVLPDLPPSIVQFIDKALQFEALDRWPSALCMREALCLALEESLGEKCDPIASRVRERIIAEFTAKAAAEAASGDVTELEPAPDLRSGPARRTPRAETPRTPRAETPRGGPSPDLPPDSVGVTALEGSDPRAREVGSGRRNVTNGATLDTGDNGSGPHAADGDVHPVVHDTGSGRSNRGIVSPRVEPLNAEDAVVGRRRGWLVTAATWAVLIGLAGLTGAGAMRKCGGIGDGTGLTASLGGAIASTDPAAQAALEAGLQLWKNASSKAARKKFAEAAQRDPGLAAAHLYFVAASDWFDHDARSHFADAQPLRGRLSAAQVGLLDALEPSMAEPPDYDLTARRLDELTKQFPKEWTLWTLRGSHDVHTRNPDHLLTIADRIPGAIGFLFRARAELHRGNLAAARTALDSCTREAPYGAVDCLISRARLESNEGACEQSALSAKKLITVDHESPDGYTSLARAEFGLTHRTSAVRAVLEEKWARVSEASRELERQRDEFFLAVLDGNFQGAYVALDGWEKAAFKSVDSSQRARPFLTRLDLDLELGRTEVAQQVARSFIEASPTWLRHDYYDQAMETTRAMYRTGLIDHAAFLQRRTADEASEIARGGVFASAGIRWLALYVETIVTPEDAELAVANRPQGAPVLDAESREVNVDAQIGRAYLLAGQVDTAIAELTRATKTCQFWKSIDGVQAHAFYGDALAKKGQKAEACNEYAFVLERWGKEPRSRSANAARESAIRLGCPGVSNIRPGHEGTGVIK
ncbi:serine/threonine protein kinase [Pendulispora rubella]|uniref:Serine/threonine protein kinase n=1 Tax=Pendulispora rubella TaxID=2741070 RepID=A0ABZ2LJD1_9BACT